MGEASLCLRPAALAHLAGIPAHLRRVGAAEPAAVPGQVIRRALALDAEGIVLVRGCGNGAASSNKADVAMARSLDQAAQLLGLRLREMLVMGRTTHVSVRAAPLPVLRRRPGPG